MMTGCMIQKTTCWNIINEGKCVPIKTYKEWNKCVMECEEMQPLETKTKPYNKEQNKWIRPRPYAYP